MHILVRERRGLEGLASPVDLDQSPGEIVVLSFSDSDLAAFAAAWRARRDQFASLRLANLSALAHPVSVDLYADKVLTHARAILARVIGGEAYWSYGLEQVRALALHAGVAFAALPGDGRADPRLEACSTVPPETVGRLRALCDAGGPEAAGEALALLSAAAGLKGPAPKEATAIAPFGWLGDAEGEGGGPLAVVVFYRSYILADDLQPVHALAAALRREGLRTRLLFAASLKEPEAARWIAAELRSAPPAIILNATAFSARDERGASPLDAAGRPVLQAILSTARREDWLGAERGLSPSDLAMHVALPEVDGRICGGVVSFKRAEPRDADLDFARLAHHADSERVRALARKAANLVRLGATPAAGRRIALVLSTYPGKPQQVAHAVGLDAIASCGTIADALRAGGYDVGDAPRGDALAGRLLRETLTWPLADYEAHLDRLPASLREAMTQAWGAPADDAAAQGGVFHFPAVAAGRLVIALQPERGQPEQRANDYHDASRVPRHAYAAFYLWLRAQGVDAIVHIGAHGTLEWLPGKAVALSEGCWPEALLGGLPVVYPFVVNDPGEAAQARRRLSAVTIGHLPPPLTAAADGARLARLEHLLDEYSLADGLDPARRNRLAQDIREEAAAGGLDQDLGLADALAPVQALERIDRFVCDLKETQFGDGLHVFGAGACGDAETAGLLDALDARRVAPGPAGSPWRGRADVLPTGRNLFAVDPRAVPSRSAFEQGVRLADELLRRHMQDHGEPPRSLVVDLWGSATMRTAGEEFAMAMHLAGLKPLWDHASERVSGFEVTAPAVLGRPRIDVTLRVSGLFRDVFAGLCQLFEAGCAALAERDGEEPEDNPYLARGPRVFGPKPGLYGLAMGAAAETYTGEARQRAADLWLEGSAYAFDAKGGARRERRTLEARVAAADAFAHAQDLPETDLLLAADYAAHEAGFAAAAASLGAKPALYHLDSTRPERPRARDLTEELARVVRARAADPRWIAGMMRHGFRGAAEIAATLDHLGAFAHLARAVPDHLFDLYFDATLGSDALVDFLRAANPAALDAMLARFEALRAAKLWTTRRNSTLDRLERLQRAGQPT